MLLDIIQKATTFVAEWKAGLQIGENNSSGWVTVDDLHVRVDSDELTVDCSSLPEEHVPALSNLPKAKMKQCGFAVEQVSSWHVGLLLLEFPSYTSIQIISIIYKL